jgi:drug/metabolite transporter (DMT)-like permease
MIALSSLVLASSAVKLLGNPIPSPSGGREARIGAELGLYLFGGSTLQVLSIQYLSAMKAALLIQCTTVVVPFLEAFLFRKRLGLRTWLACAIALLGVYAITATPDPVSMLLGALLPDSGSSGSGNADAVAGVDAAASAESEEGGAGKGSLFMFGSVLFFSMHVVRLSHFAAETDPFALARYVFCSIALPFFSCL